MKNTNSKWSSRIAAIALVGTCLCGGALAAGGDQDDPLVTLSYLTGMAAPDILAQVEARTAQRQSELEKSFDAALSDYQQKLGQSAGGGATYSVVTLSKGQKLSLDAGCEVMLRVGSATVSANTSPALIDVSTGGTLSNGGALTANHLYMATIADRSIAADTDTVKLLVRGGYMTT